MEIEAATKVATSTARRYCQNAETASSMILMTQTDIEGSNK
jgi:hypothetical protein